MNDDTDASDPNMIITQNPIKFQVVHPEWRIDIKISNDNTKGEKRVTVHYRSDTESIEDARKHAHDIYVEELGS